MNDNLFQYGEFELNKDALLRNILKNLESYINYKNFDSTLQAKFLQDVLYIKDGINNGTITTEGYGSYHDSEGLLNDDYIEALTYVDKIAKKQSTLPVKKPKLEEKVDFDLSKHGFLNYFYGLMSPYDTSGEVVGASLDLFKERYKDDEQGMWNILGEHIDKYLTKYGDFSSLNWTNLNTTSSDYIKDLQSLRDKLKDGILIDDKLLINKLGLNTLYNYLSFKSNIPQLSLNLNLNPIYGHNLTELLTEQQITLTEEPPIVPEGFKAVLKLDGSYELIPTNQIDDTLNISEFWNSLDINDLVRLITILPELGSAVTAQVPGWGTVASGILGVGSTFANFINDITDEDLSVWDSFKNAAFSGAMDVVGLLPGVGISGKASKIAKFIKPIANTLIKGWGAYGLYNASSSLQKLLNDPSNIESSDLQNIAAGIQVLAGMSSSIGTKRAVRRHTSSLDVVEVKTKSGKTVEITPEQLEDLKKTKGLEEQNKKFKGWTGEELLSEFKPAKLLSLNPKKVRLIATGPKTKKRTKREILPEDNSLDAKVLKKLNKSSEEPAKQELKLETINLDSDSSSVRSDVEVLNPKEQPKINTEDSTSKVEKAPKVEGASKFEEISEKREESVKATEIKPDTESKANKQAKINSEIAVANLTTIEKRLKNFYKKKEDKKAVESLMSYIRAFKDGRGVIGDRDARDVAAGKISGTKYYHELLSRLIASGLSEADAKKMLAVAKVFKDGGILKAKYGLTLDLSNALYKSLYNKGAKSVGLIGANHANRSNDLTIKINTPYAEELDLNKHWQKYRMYNSNDGVAQRHNDFIRWANANYTSGMSLQELLNKYNDEVDRDYKYKHSDDAITYRKEGKKYISLATSDFYDRNLGRYWSQNLIGGLHGLDNATKNWAGSTMMARSVDITDADINMDFSNSEIENEELKKLLTDNKIVKLKTGHYNYLIDDVGDSDVNGSNVSIIKPNTPISPTGEPLQYKKSFDPDILFSGLGYYRALRHNKKLADLYNQLNPLLYDPIEHQRSVEGNLRAITEGRQAAASLLSRSPLTSDASLQTAALLEAQNLGQQYIQAGLKADDERIRETSEAAWQQEKENKENRYNIAMKNRENMHLVSKEKLMAEMSRIRSNYESEDNFLKEVRTYLAKNRELNLEYDNIKFRRALLLDIYNNPLNYISGWNTYYDKIWKDGVAGNLKDEESKKIFELLLDKATDALYNYGYPGKNFGTISTSNISTGDLRLDVIGELLQRTQSKKSGGKLTKDLVKVIIDFLKESNKNYNKAIDRSIKGLYNHIKLLRKK